jgi:selenocysteine lyase/cysteine desulfurase
MGVTAIGAREEALGRRLREGLSVIQGITLYGAETGGGTVLFNVGSLPSERVGELFDERGICVRSGFHCCPLGHKMLGTPVHGAVRASVSVFTAPREIDGFLAAMQQMRK